MQNEIIQFIEKEVAKGHVPGAVIRVAYQGEVLLQEAVGSKRLYPEKASMQSNTIFDLASLTKVVATLPVILKLIEEGVVRLDDKIGYFISAFNQHAKQDVTLKHLLTHTSGLTAHRPYYQDKLSRDEVITSICGETPLAKPGEQVQYTDLGFILLYYIAEKVTGIPFPLLTKEMIFDPLQMIDTGFVPKFHKERYAVTEYNEALKDYKCGVVHDENSAMMGGISGHAGLFSTVRDLGNFVKMLENDGMYEGKRILSAKVLDISRQNLTPFSSETRGLGWMMKSSSHASCGDLFSLSSYGHTGFTGTSLWIDPEMDLSVILLTNRVHGGRNPNHLVRLRPLLHNLIYTQIEAWEAEHGRNI